MAAPEDAAQNRISMIMVGILILAVVVSWKAAIYYHDNETLRSQHAALIARNTELEKELAKCGSTVVPGWRPGVPIGRPAGAAPEPTPAK